MMVHYVAAGLTQLQVRATVLLDPAPAPAPVPVMSNPVPISPIAGAGIGILLGYCMWGVIIACGVVALVSGGLLATGQLSRNPEHADRGKRALIYSLGGVALAAIAIPTLNTVFGTVHANS